MREHASYTALRPLTKQSPRQLIIRLIAIVMLMSGNMAIGWCQDVNENSTQASASTNATDTGETNNDANLLSFLYDGSTPTSLEQLRAMEEHLADLYEQVSAATVNIAVGDSQGSGVVVTSDGYILTAAHVIDRPGLNARITFADGTVKFATTLGVHPGIDSGMLKLNQSGDFPYLDVGESETLKRGQWVAAIGHPGGLDKDRGLVLRVGRIIYKARTVIRTDCALVGGDSGGPLVDMDGYVVGIHSRIGGQLSENMHVPIDIFSEEWDMLADDFGVVIGSERPHLGLSLDGDSNRIQRIDSNQPADKAGLKVGDRIIRINDREIKNRDDLAEAIKDLKPRDKIKVVVERKVRRKKSSPNDADEATANDSESKSDSDADNADKDAQDSDESAGEGQGDRDQEKADRPDDENQDEESDASPNDQDDKPDANNSDSDSSSDDSDDDEQEVTETLEFELTVGYR